MSYLVDTNFWIECLKGASQWVAQRLRQARPTDISVCSVVVGELLPGARKHANPDARRKKVEAPLRPCPSLPFDDRAAERYAVIRDHLERRGEIIGGNDLMIAAIALTHELTVVTNNTGELGRVPGLKVEDRSA